MLGRVCEKLKRICDEEVDEKDYERRVKVAIEKEIEEEKLDRLKSELLNIAPNPYAPYDKYYSGFYALEKSNSDNRHGYNKAIEKIAKAILEGRL